MADLCVRKGEILTCINGHDICEATDDIHMGQQNWHLCLGNWRQDEPTLGARFPVCAQCGGEIFGAWTTAVYVKGRKRTFI